MLTFVLRQLSCLFVCTLMLVSMTVVAPQYSGHVTSSQIYTTHPCNNNTYNVLVIERMG